MMLIHFFLHGDWDSKIWRNGTIWRRILGLALDFGLGLGLELGIGSGLELELVPIIPLERQIFCAKTAAPKSTIPEIWRRPLSMTVRNECTLKIYA